MIFPDPVVHLPEFVERVVRLLPEYLPGMETGPAATTEGRSCWMKTWKGLLTALGRERGMDVFVREHGDSGLQRQLTMFWKRNGAVILAIFSGWGDRQDLEHRFQELQSLKAPQKVILFSCVKWQEAVIEQLEAALLKYPYHIEGEQYLALNMMGSNQSISAYVFVAPRSGSLPSATGAKLKTLPGSPFHWNRRNERPIESTHI